MKHDLLVTTDWLAERLDDPTVRVVDVRGAVTTRQVTPGVEEATYRGSLEDYRAGHIPGAVFIDWTRDVVDLDDPVPAQIAGPEKFAHEMSIRGIEDGVHVVAVDHMGGQFATRLWWALGYYGHDAVSVLDGGMNRWVEEGRDVATEPSHPPAANFIPRVRPARRATAADVLARVNDPTFQLVDARDLGQFDATKRRGPRGGRIPGATHLPRELFFKEEGGFRSIEEVRRLVVERGVESDRPVVGYCNGGVAATVVLFNLARLGWTDLVNYDGSWNEWGARLDLPIEVSK